MQQKYRKPSPKVVFTLVLLAPLLVLLSGGLWGCDNSTSNNEGNDGGVDVEDSEDYPEIPCDINNPYNPCVVAQGITPEGSSSWEDGAHTATVEEYGDPCLRRFSHFTTQELRENQPPNPRVYYEKPGWPSLSTHNTLFDALYALALEEMSENTVAALQDGAYNNGQPIPCPRGSCFETGRLWNFVWTRDTSYAVDLGLASLDPFCSRNSLEFKVSNRRGGGAPQIIQDTGSGGSYPVSTDRAVWAMGAFQLLKFLSGSSRQEFIDLAWEAVRNTIEQDRQMVFSPLEGLYLGEQSFLDWREQTYPRFTATDTVLIHMSQSLSTNVGHLSLLEFGAWLAQEKGESATHARYQSWADDLREAIDTQLFQEEFGLWGTFTPGTLDRAPVRHFDLLGTALAVLYDVGDEARRVEAVRSYPHLPKGPSVIWPQQKEIPIYHNRGIWPFVTAYWLRAAKKVGNDAAVNHNLHSLIRGAAMNLSNMENFECVSGLPWIEDGAYSGPVVNSQRQLWSVAAYLSSVHDILFGMEATPEGIRFLPYVTRYMRNHLFGGTDQLVLNNFPYHNHKTITVVVNLPPVSDQDEGAYEVGEIFLNSVLHTRDYILSSELHGYNTLTINLQNTASVGETIVIEEDVTEYRKLFAPLTPAITAVTAAGNDLLLTIDNGGENPSEILFNLYRDGVLIATDLPGTTTSYRDNTVDHTTSSPCYAVESYFLLQGSWAKPNTSQHSRAFCYWGPGYNRITTYGANQFAAVGGTYVFNHGRNHYESWGAEGDSITVSGFTPSFTGEHLIQVVYGNGAGALNTGITCVNKRVEVRDAQENVVGSGVLVMPHLGTWDEWRDSNFVRVSLTAGETYSIVIFHDETTINMSDFEHNALYMNSGGVDGPFHFVNIAELKLLSLAGAP